VRSLHRQLRTKNRQMLAMTKKMNSVFTPDQIAALSRTSNRSCIWGIETIQRALKLRFSCGTGRYKTLLDLNQPLLSLRTLRRRLENVHFESDTLTEVFSFLESKVDAMSPTERTCCLTLDEMKITPTRDYDRISDSFIGYVTLPEKEEKAEHAHVFMLGGLITRWKQTVPYCFTGVSVNGDLFHDIILEIVYTVNMAVL
jgi:hypothetical protein